MTRRYRYVGPAEIKERHEDSPGGERISDADTLAGWEAANAGEREGGLLWATYVVECDGRLRLAPRRSEHVACAQGEDVLAAGELRIEDGRVVEISNQSTGYCPDVDCWEAVRRALDAAGIERPDGFTFEAVFRLCPACGERNLIKDGWFQCECGAELPQGWNFESDAESSRQRFYRFGLRDVPLGEARDRVARLGITLERRNSEFLGGDYYHYRGQGEESVQVLANLDSYRGELLYPALSDYAVLVSVVDRRPRADVIALYESINATLLRDARLDEVDEDDE